jgi:hypothetical protein
MSEANLVLQRWVAHLDAGRQLLKYTPQGTSANSPAALMGEYLLVNGMTTLPDQAPSRACDPQQVPNCPQ